MTHHKKTVTSAEQAQLVPAPLALAERKKFDDEFNESVVESLKEEARERQKTGRGEGGSGGRGRKKTSDNLLSEVSGDSDEHPTATALAKTHGTNRHFGQGYRTSLGKLGYAGRCIRG